MECTLEELKETELGILKEFDRICKENNITYYLAYGTLLGAVRHKGFIPWDDDIDVFVKHEDFLRLKSVCKECMGEQYYYQSREDNLQNFIFWERLGLKNTTSIDSSLKSIKAEWGVGIDIFPLMPVSDIKEEQEKQISDFRKSQIMCLKYLNRATFKQARGTEKIKKIISAFIPDSINRRLYKKYMNKVGEKKEHMDNLCFDFSELGNLEYFETKWFSQCIELDFEGYKFPAPIGYKELLTTMYGDYNVIPDESNRENHSDNKNVIICLNKSYKDFI